MRRPEGGPLLRGAGAADEEGSMVHALRDVTISVFFIFLMLNVLVSEKKKKKRKERKRERSKKERIVNKKERLGERIKV